MDKNTPTLVVACNAWKGDEVGGAYKIATEFAIFCAQKGWQVHYICSHEKGTGKRPDQEAGVQIWRYPRPKTSGQGKSLRNFYAHLKGARDVTKRILAGIPDDFRGHVILNGHTALQYLGVLKGAAGRVISRKVMSVHSPLAEEYLAEKNSPRMTWRDRAAAWSLHQVERSCFVRSDVVQYDSEFSRSIFQKTFKSSPSPRGLVCPGYVDLKSFLVARIPRAEARERIGVSAWKTAEPCFFSVRRLVERMGMDHLILACAWLRKKLLSEGSARKFRLVLGGEGPLKSTLEKQTLELGLSDCVYFVGRIPERELALHYRAADCFVLPTRALECFGLVILESFAAGTPVIATPVGAIPEVLGPFGDLSLTHGTRPEDIGEAMLHFLNEPPPNRESEYYQYVESYEKNAVLDRLSALMESGEIKN